MALERAPDAVVVSLDGRAAYDTMSRESFLTALQDAAPSLLPFVRLFYGRTSIYYWWDDTGRRREVHQGEGCEQGDPLAPALYAIGQHAALLAAQSRLQADEEVFAFLDDLYVLTTLPRARVARDVVAGAVEAGCGIASNHGKTRIFGWSNAPAPPEVADLGPDVWRGNKPPHQRGFVVLGAPIGHPAFIQAWADERLQERRLLHELPELPDLQCAWLLLALCASPRANHALRTLPPSEVAGYAAAHDAALWDTFLSCIGGAPEHDAHAAWLIAGIPATLGGLGLQSAARTSPAAYWASWADALPVIRARRPHFAAACVAELDGAVACRSMSLQQASDARALLLTEGWTSCPTWAQLLANHQRKALPDRGLGDWPHGWQHHATRTRTSYFRDRVLLPTLDPASRALLRSQAGPQAGAWLTAIPSDEAHVLAPEAMQIALRRRLRLALPLTSNTCGGNMPGCGRPLDPLGDHAVACPRTGLLARRAKIVEHAWVRVAREAIGPEGQVVPQQWLTHTTAPGVASDDRRRLDMVIYGVTPWGGALCCDATLVSPVSRDGQPQGRSADTDGAALATATRRKEATYPELLRNGPQRLVVLSSEVGGRWGTGALALVRDFVRLRRLRAPPALRHAAATAWARRWWTQLSVAVQRATALSAAGRAWPAASRAAADAPAFELVLDLADAAGPSMLPFRA